MIARILVTGLMLALAAGAFFGATQLSSGPLSPFGILFLTIAGVIWFAWQEICEGFSYGPGSSGDSTELPLAAGFGPMFIKGITNARRTAQPPRRSSDFQMPEPLTQPSPRKRGEG